MGEIAQVRVITDNSQCSKDIKNFKFKLVRRYEGHADDYRNCEQIKDILNLKFAGCRRGERTDRTFQMQIPTTEDYNHDALSKCQKEFHPLLPQMSTSFHGKLINIDYVLKLFVKHDSWNELGEG